IPYRSHGRFENWRRCRAAFRGKSIRLAGALLVPNLPFRRLKLLAFFLAPLYFLAVNENLNEFMLRPGSLGAIWRHIWWRLRNFAVWCGDNLRSREWRSEFSWWAARVAGTFRRTRIHKLAPV